MSDDRASLFPFVRTASIGDLLRIVAEPDCPEDRDDAWDEIARREGERLALKAVTRA